MHLSAPTISFASHHSITVQAYNQPCNPLLQQSNVHADVLYADSPYNSREYLPNYHILETIARYDYPLLHGVTGMRNYENQKSDFCKKSRVAEAFNQLIQNAQVSYVVISYNSEGLLSTEDLTKLCQQYAVTGTFSLKEIPYRKYKSKQQSAFTRPLCEQIYAFKKNSDF
jgi:adenine-specific DNA-methyltransferase